MSRSVRGRIEDIAWDRTGRFGLAARRLSDGCEIVAGDPDRLYQLASVFKVPVLATLEARVLAGELSWDLRHRLVDEDKSPGSGILIDLDPGLSLSLEDLATLMMTLSDNTATDLCFATAEQPRIMAQLKAWGIVDMSIVADCKTLLADLAGVAVADIVAADPVRKQTLLDRERNPATAAFGQDRTKTNLASPRAMVDLLLGIVGGRFLPRPAARHMFGIMALEWYRHRIPPRLPAGVRWATKSGSLGGLVNDVGVMWTERGPVAMAMFATDLSDDERWERVIARTAEAVHEALG